MFVGTFAFSISIMRWGPLRATVFDREPIVALVIASFVFFAYCAIAAYWPNRTRREGHARPLVFGAVTAGLCAVMLSATLLLQRVAPMPSARLHDLRNRTEIVVPQYRVAESKDEYVHRVYGLVEAAMRQEQH